MINKLRKKKKKKGQIQRKKSFQIWKLVFFFYIIMCQPKIYNFSFLKSQRYIFIHSFTLFLLEVRRRRR